MLLYTFQSEFRVLKIVSNKYIYMHFLFCWFVCLFVCLYIHRKELSFCNKLWLSNHYIFLSQCHRPLIFQTMNSDRSNNLCLKYKRFTPSGYSPANKNSSKTRLLPFRSGVLIKFGSGVFTCKRRTISGWKLYFSPSKNRCWLDDIWICGWYLDDIL